MFYAVRKGRKPGVYDSWNEAKEQVEKFPGAVYKKFALYNDAEDYAFPDIIEEANEKTDGVCMSAYTDGTLRAGDTFFLKMKNLFMRVMAEQENTLVCETSPVRLKRPKPQLKRLPNLGLPDSTSITTMKESAVGRMATGRQLAKELLNMGSSSIRCVSIWKSISIR